jgi:hypothetical protein
MLRAATETPHLVMREQQQTGSTGVRAFGPRCTGAGLATLPLAVTFINARIFYICVLRTISAEQMLRVVGGLGSVLLLLPTLAQTAPAPVIVLVAALARLAWALRCYC